MVEQYEVYWVELDPTRGGEMAKTRPCVVVTPSDLNMYLTTVVIVPITSTIRNYPYRVLCSRCLQRWKFGCRFVEEDYSSGRRREYNNGRSYK